MKSRKENSRNSHVKKDGKGNRERDKGNGKETAEKEIERIINIYDEKAFRKFCYSNVFHINTNLVGKEREREQG